MEMNALFRAMRCAIADMTGRQWGGGRFADGSAYVLWLCNRDTGLA